jgi:hypothetical protein
VCEALDITNIDGQPIAAGLPAEVATSARFSGTLKSVVPDLQVKLFLKRLDQTWQTIPGKAEIRHGSWTHTIFLPVSEGQAQAEFAVAAIGVSRLPPAECAAKLMALFEVHVQAMVPAITIAADDATPGRGLFRTLRGTMKSAPHGASIWILGRNDGDGQWRNLGAADPDGSLSWVKRDLCIRLPNNLSRVFEAVAWASRESPGGDLRDLPREGRSGILQLPVPAPKLEVVRANDVIFKGYEARVRRGATELGLEGLTENVLEGDTIWITIDGCDGGRDDCHQTGRWDGSPVLQPPGRWTWKSHVAESDYFRIRIGVTNRDGPSYTITAGHLPAR